MRSDLTDITLVIDRSGSMQGIHEDAQGGVNAFVERQSKATGEALLTLVQFDTEYEFLHHAMPIDQVPKYVLVPRGSTALLDAVGRAINETKERLAKVSEDDRPGLVVFVIVTDGLENSSREFARAQIKQLIKQQQLLGWQFTFLGADQDAFAEAQSLGIAAEGAAVFTKHNVAAAYAGATAKVARMREQRRAGETVDNRFTLEELDAMD